jgi:hypothetical protein
MIPMMNESLRALVAKDLAPVRPLRHPFRRALAIVPLAAVLLVAAPLVFSVRDITTLGWFWSWGASTLEMIVGVIAVALALRESIPGRAWSVRALVGVVGSIAILWSATTLGAWHASPVILSRHWWMIAAICAACSALTALPAVALSSVLIAQAYPVRPYIAGALGGLGSGLMADAGWRLFCHYSDPSHVVVAHLGGVTLAASAGLSLTAHLVGRAYPYSPGYTSR